MKNLKISLLSVFTMTVLLFACKKQENQVFVESSKYPVLTASKTAVTLAPGLESQSAIKLFWTNPNYVLTTGINSLDISYKLEMDTLGGNFNSSNKFTTVIPRDLSLEWTVAQLNGVLGNTMQLTFGREFNIEIRITATIGQTARPLTSNSIVFKATPFAPPPKVQVPVTGELYLVGDATPGGWNNPVPVPTQKFTKLSNTKYELTVALGASKFYLMLPENGSWASKYCVEDNSIPGLSGGGNFVFKSSGGSDIPSPSEAGNYKITADFQTGKFTVAKQ